MKIENRQQLLVVVTVAVLALLVLDSVVFEPLVGWYGTRAKQITELRNQVKNGKGLLARSQGIRGHWKEMLANTLPNKSSVADQKVISAFDQWSRDTGVEITDIMPQWKNDTDDYQTLNCRVEASGNLAALSQFLYDVEKGQLAIKLDSLELSSKDNGGQTLNLGLQVSGLALINPTQP